MTSDVPFKLGHRVFTFLLDMFLFHDFSVLNFTRGLQVWSKFVDQFDIICIWSKFEVICYSTNICIPVYECWIILHFMKFSFNQTRINRFIS